jgi:hypothetical protein
VLLDLIPVLGTQPVFRIEHQQSANKIFQIAVDLLASPSPAFVSRSD